MEPTRVAASGLKMPVVGALFLLAIHRNLGRVHIQHYALLRVNGVSLRNQLTINGSETGKILLLSQSVYRSRPGTRIHEITGVPNPQGVAFSPEANEPFVAR